MPPSLDLNRVWRGGHGGHPSPVQISYPNFKLGGVEQFYSLPLNNMAVPDKVRVNICKCQDRIKALLSPHVWYSIVKSDLSKL